MLMTTDTPSSLILSTVRMSKKLMELEKLLLLLKKQLIDKAKQPVPVHTLVHAWGYLAYDSDRKKFAFLSWNGEATKIPRYFLGGEKQMDEGLKMLEEQQKAGDYASFVDGG